MEESIQYRVPGLRACTSEGLGNQATARSADLGKIRSTSEVFFKNKTLKTTFFLLLIAFMIF
jgi:hypothetical protein